VSARSIHTCRVVYSRVVESTIRAASKPCLAYKVLAAGQADLSASGVWCAFEETLASIKPGDGMIVGMSQQLGDQVGTNARFVRELCAG